jgi:hypothetical protein
MIENAASALRKSSTARPSSDDIVAEVKFAFWVGLLGPHYDSTIWRETFYKAFTPRHRKTVHGRLNAIRRLRNRVAHHEPIFHRSPLHLHSEIIEAIGWMCTDTMAWARHNSRFEHVYNLT